MKFLKINIIIFILFLLAFSLKAQSWQCFGDFGLPYNFISSLAAYNDELYISAFDQDTLSGDYNKVLKWDKSSLSQTGSFGSGWNIWDMEVFDGNLYVAGDFLSVEGIPTKCIVKWDGNNWLPVLDYATSDIDQIVGMTVFNNELYIGGTIITINGDSMHNVARWNGTDWQTVGNGFDGEVTSFAVYRDTLYAGGWFNSSGTNDSLNKIARWNGFEWKSLKNGLTNQNFNFVRAMISYLDTLYVGGAYYALIDSIPYNRLAKWYNQEWYPFKDYFGSQISTMYVYADDLYFGGKFVAQTTDTPSYYIRKIARWDGYKLDSLQLGVSGNVDALQEYNNQLFVGGPFSSAGGDSCLRLAIWSMPTDISEENNLNKSNVDFYPNPFSFSTKFRVEDGQGKNYQLTFYDLLGRKVKKIQIRLSDDEHTIYRDGLGNGMYIYEVKENESFIGKGKVIVN